MQQTLRNTKQAFKEWQVAVAALEQGKTIALLRKGGIRETGGRFKVECDRVLLYPTYEHQKPELLKAVYAAQVQTVESGWHPETVRIGSWAQITDIFQVTDEAIATALEPFHCWNEAFVRDRLKWHSSQPLYVLLLRVYRLTEPQQIPFSVAYGGCKSWIDLAAAIELDSTQPVLDDAGYAERVAAIRAIVAGQS